MTDLTAVPGDPVRSSRAPMVLVVVVALGVVLVASWISGVKRSPGWGGPVFAVVSATAIAVIVVLTKTWTDRRAWLAAGGCGGGRDRVGHQSTPRGDLDRAGRFEQRTGRRAREARHLVAARRARSRSRRGGARLGRSPAPAALVRVPCWLRAPCWCWAWGMPRWASS